MKNDIAQKFGQIIAAVQAGADIVEAFEAQFGAGSYVRLAGMIYDDLRAAQPTPPAPPTAKAPATKIGEARQVIRGAMWTRNDLTGGTRDEFVRQAVGPSLRAKIDELRALAIAPRFAADIADRDAEIERCAAVIARWEAAQPVEAPKPSALVIDFAAARAARAAA